jgi:hypothetical protein
MLSTMNLSVVSSPAASGLAGIALRVVVVSCLAVWLLATCLAQFNYSWVRRVVSDPLHIIPRWTFFAPNPGTSDFHLVFRQVSVTGEMSHFREMSTRRRRRLAVLFNPEKRANKALHDLSVMLASLIATRNWDETTIQYSFPYLGLLNMALTQPRDPTTEKIQFCLLCTSGYRDSGSPVMIITSGFHRV